MKNLRLGIFLGILNNLELWRADIGNAYLEAITEEKLYTVAGPEFEDWEGYIADGPLTYHLGANYYHDPDRTMVCQPKKCIEKLKETYIRLFNTEPSKGLKTSLEKNDHPELDTSDILEGQQVNHHSTSMACNIGEI